jgi:hypothetical protein
MIIIESSAKIQSMDGALIRGRGKIVLKETAATGLTGVSSIQVKVKQ